MPFQKNNWNEEQKMIVLEATSLCTGNRPGIYCVKGPPGTGKSTVIVNLLQQILFADKRRTDGRNPMILLTAPSNTAVDNLIFKIGSARNNLSIGEYCCFDSPEVCFNNHSVYDYSK